LAHQDRVADALEGIVSAAAGELLEQRNDFARDVLGVDKVGSAELACQRFPAWIDVNTDYAACTEILAPCTTLRPTPPRPKTTMAGAGRHAHALGDSSDTRGYTA